MINTDQIAGMKDKKFYILNSSENTLVCNTVVAMWLKDKWHKVYDGSKYFLLRLISIDLESRNIFKVKTFLNV